MKKIRAARKACSFLPIVCLLLALIAVSTAPAAQRVRFGPGVCGPIDASYDKGATATGGQPFPLGTAELGNSSRIMESSLLNQMILWASADRDRSYVIPIDSTVSRMMLSGSFDGTGGSLTLVGPDGQVAQKRDGVEDTALNCVRIITVDAPARGDWQVRIAPTRRFWLAVRARSDLSVEDVSFVERERPESDRFVSIQGQPVTARPATLGVSLSSGITLPTFQLVSLDAEPLHQVDLQPMDGGEFRGTIVVPTESFRVLVSGLDASGARVQRIWPGLFQAEAVEVIPPPGETVTAGSEQSVSFTIRNHGPAVRLALVAVNDRGQVIPVDPSALDIGPGGEGVAAVRLAVPGDAQPGSQVSLLLTATSDAAAATGGFNSGRKAFTVIRD